MRLYMPKDEKGDIFMKKLILSIMVFFFVFLNFNVLFAALKADFGGTGRYGAVGFSIGNKGYIGTGYNGSTYFKDFWEYDLNANTWTQKAEFGGNTRFSAVAFAIGDKGYIGTGNDGSTALKDFWEYDPNANTWTQKAEFGGNTRFSAVAFAIGDKGYIGTGNDGSTALKDFWEYDPNANTWTQKAEFGEDKRYGAVALVIGNKGYVGTGFNGTTVYKDFWEYDPDTNTWEQKTDFGGEPRFAAVSFSFGNTGYIGTGINGSIYYKDFWEYDSINNTWTRKSNFEGTERYGAVGFAIGNKGYVGTGADQQTGYKDFFEYNQDRDAIPDEFTFIDQTEVAWSKDITSNTITVSGLSEPATISITGGTYSINGGSFTSENGTVNNGDTVSVKQTSAATSNTKTDAELTIGDGSDTFSVTTKYMMDVGDSDPFCFIATAAFGSPMAHQVEILRQFRDRYLLTNKFGREFVRWYYRNGPIAAKFIQDKPVVKTAVRAALYPLIGFSFLLISGYWPLAMIVFLLSILFFYRFKTREARTT